MTTWDVVHEDFSCYQDWQHWMLCMRSTSHHWMVKRIGETQSVQAWKSWLLKLPTTVWFVQSTLRNLEYLCPIIGHGQSWTRSKTVLANWIMGWSYTILSPEGAIRIDNWTINYKYHSTYPPQSYGVTFYLCDISHHITTFWEKVCLEVWSLISVKTCSTDHTVIPLIREWSDWRLRRQFYAAAHTHYLVWTRFYQMDVPCDEPSLSDSQQPFLWIWPPLEKLSYLEETAQWTQRPDDEATYRGAKVLGRTFISMRAISDIAMCRWHIIQITTDFEEVYKIKSNLSQWTIEEITHPEVYGPVCHKIIKLNPANNCAQLHTYFLLRHSLLVMFWKHLEGFRSQWLRNLRRNILPYFATVCDYKN